MRVWVVASLMGSLYRLVGLIVKKPFCRVRRCTSSLVNNQHDGCPAMTSSTSNVLLTTLMFATGIGIPIMAALNGKLGGQLGSPWAAAFILFIVAGAISAVAMFAAGMPQQ